MLLRRVRHGLYVCPGFVYVLLWCIGGVAVSEDGPDISDVICVLSVCAFILTSAYTCNVHSKKIEDLQKEVSILNQACITRALDDQKD